MVLPVPPARVVFIPGVMGSALGYPLPAREMSPEVVEKVLKLVPGTGWALETFDENTHTIWGRNSMAWYALNQLEKDLLHSRLCDTDGRTNPGRAFLLPSSSTSVQESALTRIDLYWTTGAVEIPYDEFLRDLHFSEPRTDIRIFCYDWRLSNSYSARRLAEFIKNEWGSDRAPQRDGERVTIIAHSMGGLIARYYIESPELAGYRFVKRLVTVGTPHLGAPIIYTHIRGTSPDGWVNERLLSRDQQSDLAERLDSFAEMLPVYDFVRLRTGSLQRWRSTLSELILRRYPPAGTNRQTKYVDALSIVEAFRSALVSPPELQAWLAWRRVQYVFWAGLGGKTIGQVAPGSVAVQDLLGDNRVPYRSALNFGATSKRDIRSEMFARNTLKVGMLRRPPMRNTSWLLRKTWTDESHDHNNAMHIEVVRDDLKESLTVDGDSLRTQYLQESTQYSTDADLVRVGNAIAVTIGRRLAPQVTCVTRLKFTPSRKDARPPLPYSISHFPPGFRPAFPEFRWLEKGRESIEERFLQTFPDVLAGVRVGRTVYDKRFILIDRQVEAKATHPAGGAIFIDEGTAENELVLVTWSTGELLRGRNQRNEHHAESHFVQWWNGQRLDWQADWRSSLSGIDMRVNLSPCSLCCGDLLTINRETFPNLERASIRWFELYPGDQYGNNRTQPQDLQKLERNKPEWFIVSEEAGNPPFRSPRVLPADVR